MSLKEAGESDVVSARSLGGLVVIRQYVRQGGHTILVLSPVPMPRETFLYERAKTTVPRLREKGLGDVSMGIKND